MNSLVKEMGADDEAVKKTITILAFNWGWQVSLE